MNISGTPALIKSSKRSTLPKLTAACKDIPATSLALIFTSTPIEVTELSEVEELQLERLAISDNFFIFFNDNYTFIHLLCKHLPDLKY